MSSERALCATIDKIVLTPRIHPRSVFRLASVVAGKITSLQRKGWLTGNKLEQSRRLPTFELAAVYVGCGVGCPGLVGRRLSSASVVRLKCYRSHVVYERRLCVVPARLKNDLLHARPVYGVKLGIGRVDLGIALVGNTRKACA